MKSVPASDCSGLIKDHRDLLTCLRLTDRRPAPARLADLGPAAWEKVYRQSIRQAVTPLLYHRLQRAGALKWVPGQVEHRCRGVYLTVMSRNLQLQTRLADVLRRLNAEHIPVVVLKGAHLAEKVYGDIALRIFDDVDLLLAEKDLQRCRAIFSESPGRGPLQDLPLDIQWNIDHSVADLPIQVESLRRRSRRTTIAGVETRVLCAEDLLLHLCLHAAFHHQFQLKGLRALCDVRQTVLLFEDELDWHGLTGRAAKWGAGNAVGLTLTLARELLGAVIPPDALERLTPGGLAFRPRQWAVRRMLAIPPTPFVLSPYFWKILRPDALHRKLSYLRHLILPARPRMIQKFEGSADPGGLSLSYGRRLKANIGRYLKAVWGLLSKREDILHEADREIENMDMMEWLAGHFKP